MQEIQDERYGKNPLGRKKFKPSPRKRENSGHSPGTGSRARIGEERFSGSRIVEDCVIYRRGGA